MSCPFCYSDGAWSESALAVCLEGPRGQQRHANLTQPQAARSEGILHPNGVPRKQVEHDSGRANSARPLEEKFTLSGIGKGSGGRTSSPLQEQGKGARGAADRPSTPPARPLTTVAHGTAAGPQALLSHGSLADLSSGRVAPRPIPADRLRRDDQQREAFFGRQRPSQAPSYSSSVVGFARSTSSCTSGGSQAAP